MRTRRKGVLKMVKRDCPDIDELAAISAGLRAVTAHVAACASCQHVLNLARRAREVGVSSASLESAAEELTSQLKTLIQMPFEERMLAIGGAEYRRLPLAQRFQDLARLEWERDLGLALEHSVVATAILDSLGSSTLSRELRFDAWKDRSTIHRERGEPHLARAALSRADAEIPFCANRQLKTAIVQFATATICAERDVWEPDEALRLLDASASTFAALDPERWIATQVWRGMIYHRSERYVEALNAFSDVAQGTTRSNSAAWADANRNVAFALIRLDRVSEGESLLADVRKVDVGLSRQLFIVRDDALLATAADARDDFEAAAVGYADVQQRLAALGEHETSHLMGKNLAVVLVALGRFDAAANVLRQLLSSVVENSDRRRFTAEALHYLRHLALREVLTHPIALHVSRYLDRIHDQRATAFRPPEPLYLM